MRKRFGRNLRLNRMIQLLALMALVPGLVLADEPATAVTVAAQLRVPPGFRIDELVSVPKARSMALGDNGTLFVSTQFAGKVYAVSDVFGGQPTVRLVLDNLRIANGVAFSDGDLYVAESARLLRYAAIEKHLDDPGEPEVLFTDLPAGKLHSWRYIAFGPDGKLYMAIGAPCNVCDAPDSGLILRMDRDGKNAEIYARGVRNSVGFDWQPVSGDLWFTENGRDMLGDDLPPDELNTAAKPGLHFGFPFCHGASISEPAAELAALGSCADSQPPVLELPAHVVPLGMVFYQGEMFPAAYHNQIFIAEHGSWNRSEKAGYRVSLVRLDESGHGPVSYEPFVTGWLNAGEVSGRPVDLLVAPDGSLLVSDDYAGKIYRVSYKDTSRN